MTTHRPLVSVVIPAYNVATYLAEAIDSALAQTYPNFEVVVVDDGSTDGTAEVLARYGDRVVRVSQENRGLAAARNAGIRASRGEVIALLDGDDAWLPTRLERCVPVLEARPEIGLVTSDAYLIEDGVRTEKRTYGARRRYPFPAREEDQLDEIARRNFLFVSVLFRRSLVDRHGGFDETMRRAEDYEMWTRCLLGGTRAAFVNEPLCYYRVRSDSLSASPEQWGAHLSVLERHLPALWREGARGRARDCFEIGEALTRRGDRRRAVSFFLHAVRGEGADVGARVRFAALGVLRLVGPPGADRRNGSNAPRAAATSRTGSGG